jgi:hypothetical protein
MIQMVTVVTSVADLGMLDMGIDPYDLSGHVADGAWGNPHFQTIPTVGTKDGVFPHGRRSFSRSIKKPAKLLLEQGVSLEFTEISYRWTEMRKSQQASHSTQVLCSHGVRLLCVSRRGCWGWATSGDESSRLARRLQESQKFRDVGIPVRRKGRRTLLN